MFWNVFLREFMKHEVYKCFESFKLKHFPHVTINPIYEIFKTGLPNAYTSFAIWVFGSRFEKAINRGRNKYSLKNHNLVSMKNVK